MIPIGRVFVGEFMSSPQNRRSHRTAGAPHSLMPERVSNADRRTDAEAPIVAFWTATFFAGDDKQTARTRSNEDERRFELRAVGRYSFVNSGT
jgi:hypothetical protein